MAPAKEERHEYKSLYRAALDIRAVLLWPVGRTAAHEVDANARMPSRYLRGFVFSARSSASLRLSVENTQKSELQRQPR
jgi:hypothetical protein